MAEKDHKHTGGTGTATAEKPAQPAASNGNAAPARKGGKPKVADPNETKEHKFRRLALQRVPKACKAIGKVRNLFNRQNYDFTPEQAKKVLAALGAEMDALVAAMDNTTVTQQTFTI